MLFFFLGASRGKARQGKSHVQFAVFSVSSFLSVRVSPFKWTMKVKFTCVAFVERNVRIGVLGSCDSLGNWTQSAAKVLTPQTQVISALTPTCFTAILDVPEITRTSVENDRIYYKFIAWEHPDQLATPEQWPTLEEVKLSESTTLLSADTYLIPLKQDENLTPPTAETEIIWEGLNSSHNRLICFENMKLDEKPEVLSHLLDMEANYVANAVCGLQDVYLLPPADFVDPKMYCESFHSELKHTTRYYNRVKSERTIHFNEVLPRVFVGSCPRRVDHLTFLKTECQVGCVFNFQALEDLEKNWIEPESAEDKSPFRLRQIYAEQGMLLIYIPTVDMCSESRAAMLAQAAALLSLILIGNPDKSVYIHCNAGVGRAIGCVCAFLHFCVGMPLNCVEHFIRSRRPVGYFDAIALRAGKKDYEAKFDRALKVFEMTKIQPQETASL